jgi:hypothetical protein
MKVDLSSAAWRKSSRSGAVNNRVEVARMCGYYFGGENNFESDRMACMELDKLSSLRYLAEPPAIS